MKELLDKWKNDTLSPAELLALMNALESENGEREFEKIWGKVWEDPSPRPDEAYVEKRLEEIRTELKAKIAEKPTKVLRITPWLTAVAAGVAILVLGIWLWRQVGSVEKSLVSTPQWAEITIPKGGEPQQLVLPDSSIVWLNVDSKLRYQTPFSDSLREVYLEGEAYFEVQRNEQKPFVVQASHTHTEVLGTHFYVSAYPEEDLQVTLVSGKVRVSNQEKMEAILDPKDRLTVSDLKRKWHIGQVDTEGLGGWKRGLFEYSGIPIGVLERKIERQFGVEISFKDERSKKCIIVGKPSDGSIWDLLESYAFISGIKYRSDENGTILISGGDCP